MTVAGRPWKDVGWFGALRRAGIRICWECGQVHRHDPSQRGPAKAFCNRHCKHLWTKRRHDALSDRRCRICGKQLTEYQVIYGHSDCCSRVCGWLAHRSFKGTLRTCEICGDEFEPRAAAQRTCGGACGREAQLRTVAGMERAFECKACGTSIVVTGCFGGNQPQYCTGCTAERERDRSRRRRRACSGPEAEEIRDRDVFQRDGWVCQLCGGPVNPRLRWPDPLSKSLDHIIPLKHGGAHRWENVQLAHLRCNIKKHDHCEDGS